MTTPAEMIVFTAPSGAGKTTVVRFLLSKYPQLSFSVSATTRAKRAHETAGKDYYFMQAEEFKAKIENGEFAEWEEVYPDQFYGTLKSEIDRVRSLDKIVVFDIDVKGALNLKRLYGDSCRVVFVMPPDINTLIERLKSRNTESAESLQRRISKAESELQYAHSFDHILLNNRLEETLKFAEDLVTPMLNH
jgi:guanylate kinase